MYFASAQSMTGRRSSSSTKPDESERSAVRTFFSFPPVFFSNDTVNAFVRAIRTGVADQIQDSTFLNCAFTWRVGFYLADCNILSLSDCNFRPSANAARAPSYILQKGVEQERTSNTLVIRLSKVSWLRSRELFQKFALTVSSDFVARVNVCAFRLSVSPPPPSR